MDFGPTLTCLAASGRPPGMQEPFDERHPSIANPDYHDSVLCPSQACLGSIGAYNCIVVCGTGFRKPRSAVDGIRSLRELYAAAFSKVRAPRAFGPQHCECLRSRISRALRLSPALNHLHRRLTADRAPGHPNRRFSKTGTKRPLKKSPAPPAPPSGPTKTNSCCFHGQIRAPASSPAIRRCAHIEGAPQTSLSKF